MKNATLRAITDRMQTRMLKIQSWAGPYTVEEADGILESWAKDDKFWDFLHKALVNKQGLNALEIGNDLSGWAESTHADNCNLLETEKHDRETDESYSDRRDQS